MLIKIEKLVYGGEGLAHHDGATVFVPFVLPGEEVSVQASERKKKFVRGRPVQIVAPSPDRVVPRCPHFAVCGGCDYQHTSYQRQLTYKQEILRETLRRIGHIDSKAEIVTHSAEPWAYRNRAQWKVRPWRGPDGAESPAIGYFQRGSASLCPIIECPIISPALFGIFQAASAALRSGLLPHSVREIEAFADDRDVSIVLNFTFDGFPARAGELAAALRKALPGAASVLLQDVSGERMELSGPGYMECQIAESVYRVSHLSFFQINRFLIAELQQAVVAAAGSGAAALDLFAGVGLFTIPLARNFSHTTAVEAHPAAARDLQVNLAAALGPHARRADVRAGDVDDFLSGWRGTADCVVLDPPRAGVSPGALQTLARPAAKRLVYVSCDPATLARDLAFLVNYGYNLSELHYFDLFPQSFHIEAMAVLTAGTAAR